jgi:hypothetical protein
MLLGDAGLGEVTPSNGRRGSRVRPMGADNEIEAVHRGADHRGLKEAEAGAKTKDLSRKGERNSE